MSNYYARNDEEREFDNTIRESVKKSKSKCHMAFFLQGQEELSLLRHLLDNQYALEDEIHVIHDMMKKRDILEEKHDIKIDNHELLVEIRDKLDELGRTLNDVMVYLCESEDTGLYDDINEDVLKIRERAKSYAKLKREYADSKARLFEDVSMADIWSYIVCCLFDD